MSVRLWTETWRPATLADFVWVDPEMRGTVEHWLQDGALPHCLFSGVSGTGKTSLVKLLMKLLDIPSTDILLINASRDRQIDPLQAKISEFVQAWTMGPSGFKYILLDEADRLSPYAQGLLRNEMESYADSCRFILTANYPERIQPAIHSRCQTLHFPRLERDAYIFRLADILVAEKISFTPEVLLAHVAVSYPDLRKGINRAQQNCHDGVLVALRDEDNETVQDYMDTAFDLFKKNRFLDGRKLICAQVQDYEECYRRLYRNVAIFGPTQDQQDDALLIIKKALLHHATIADPEINLSSCLVELSRLGR